MTSWKEKLVKFVENYPDLDIGDRVGGTGYIDFLRWDEIPYPVMKGKDCENRFFIVMKVMVEGEKLMQVIFQRFEARGGVHLDLIRWNSGRHPHVDDLLNTCGSIREEQFEFFYNLIKNRYDTKRIIEQNIEKRITFGGICFNFTKSL